MTTIKSKIKTLIESNDTLWGRRFDIAIQLLIIVSIIAFSVETLPSISDEFRNWLRVIEIATVSIFTLEYLARVWVADTKFKYIFSFYGLIDLLSILPFYLAIGTDLRGLRAFRLLRIFQMLKLVRYSKAVQRFHRAFLHTREEIILFICVTLILLWLAAIGIYHFENEAQPEAFSSVFASLWWAMVTLTTVGYGDVYPITNGGKFFTFILLIIGLGIVAVPAGLVATGLNKAREEDVDT